MNLLDKQQRYLQLGLGPLPASALADGLRLSGQVAGLSSELGRRVHPDYAHRHLYRQFVIEPGLQAAIRDIREMDKLDQRVKKIHSRTARSIVKGGLRLVTSSDNKRIIRAWKRFEKRLNLNRSDKLQSDARGLMMEGNLPMQWVLGPDRRVVAGVRMPTETIIPQVGPSGRFDNPAHAYDQVDLTEGRTVARFALWQLSMARVDPDNYDDHGCFGRPYLDASRTVWKKLTMTEEDLVIRRRMRAPFRLGHSLDGATKEELDQYRHHVETSQANGATTDFFSNKKLAITAIQGDANLDQIADVVHLLDTFYAGSPAPKGLFGYAGQLSRDILEDLKKDYFEEIDTLQDTLSLTYQQGFTLDLLLAGINPDAYEFSIQFAERRTETANQRADLALKQQALGIPREMVWAAAGHDPAAVKEQLEAEAKENDPYPEPDGGHNPPAGTVRPTVNVTPSNARKGESATTISTRNNGS
ncbi:MAG: hypothetical protein HQL72_02390 [Magnetococcales bacterium]|nr:hypothetical protein [Magnetococcales bacterium]